MGTTSKAVIKLFGWTNRKGGGFFVVKGTQPQRVDAPFLLLYVAPNDICHVDTGKKILNKRIWDQRLNHT